MNKRLEDIYNNLANTYRQPFLHNELIFDTMWGKPIEGITLQVDLSEETRTVLSSLQQQLLHIEPGLFVQPRLFQHMSFNQVVYWNGEYAHGQMGTWETIRGEFLSRFLALDGIFPSFPVSFQRLIPMTSAIIWCAVDDYDEMQHLRNHFKQVLPFPKETTKENTFIHTTVARFITKLRNSSRVFSLLQQFHQSVSMPVKEIILRAENRYPSLDTTELARIRLTS